MTLEELGWNDALAQAFEPHRAHADLCPGRVAIEFNYLYRVALEAGDVEAVIAGRLKHHASSRSELPAVGDWVVIRTGRGEAQATIRAVLPRHSRFSRKVAGHVTDEQVVAANVDVAFLVMGLDADFNLRRLERYLLLARESGAQPVILLTKPDLSTTVEAAAAAVASVAHDLPVHVISPRTGQGLEMVSGYLLPGITGALLGSSGAGKSTIINRLLGVERQRTRDVRETDARGRHTTTHRELIALPSGGVIIDTPGMRELQLWDVGDAVSETFEDIEVLADACRFSDCRHRSEPQCAVRAAVDAGALAAERLDSYVKLQDELTHLARQQDERLQLEEKRRGRVHSKAVNARLKQKRRV